MERGRKKKVDGFFILSSFDGAEEQKDRKRKGGQGVETVIPVLVGGFISLDLADNIYRIGSGYWREKGFQTLETQLGSYHHNYFFSILFANHITSQDADWHLMTIDRLVYIA